jgi:Tol biopolymer transport system component
MRYSGPSIEMVNAKTLRRWSLGAGYSPTWSSDGRFIAFTRTVAAPLPPTPPDCVRVVTDVFVGSRDGHAQRDVTNFQRGSAREPIWSPDGSEIAYFVDSGDGNGIAVVPVSGGAPRFVTRHSWAVAYDQELAWSPDGRQLAFVRQSSALPGSRIWVINADGSDPRLLTRGPRRSDSVPTWSPDGRKIAFARSYFETDSGHTRIWVMNSDGSGK